MKKDKKPNFKVKHPYAHLIQCMLLGIILMFSSVLVSSTSLFGFNKLGNSDSTEQENEVQAATPSGNWYDYASSSSSAVYLSGTTFYINTAAGLAYAARWASNTANPAAYASYTYKLNNDIDLSAHYWNYPFGLNDSRRFKGTFDGQGHRIYGICIKEGNWQGGGDDFGFFRYTQGAKIKNVKFDYKVGKSYNSINGNTWGGVVARTRGGSSTKTTISDVWVSGYMFQNTGIDRVGGFVGEAESWLEFNRCYSTIFLDTEGGNTSNDHYIGGFVGYSNESSDVRFNYCVFRGVVWHDYGGGNAYAYGGGFIGRNNHNGSWPARFTGCVSAGLVTGNANWRQGGFVGYCKSNSSSDYPIYSGCVSLSISRPFGSTSTSVGYNFSSHGNYNNSTNWEAQFHSTSARGTRVNTGNYKGSYSLSNLSSSWYYTLEYAYDKVPYSTKTSSTNNASSYFTTTTSRDVPWPKGFGQVFNFSFSNYGNYFSPDDISQTGRILSSGTAGTTKYSGGVPNSGSSVGTSPSNWSTSGRSTSFCYIAVPETSLNIYILELDPRYYISAISQTAFSNQTSSGNLTSTSTSVANVRTKKYIMYEGSTTKTINLTVKERTGSSSNPYIIKNNAQLHNFRVNLGASSTSKYTKQIANVTMYQSYTGYDTYLGRYYCSSYSSSSSTKYSITMNDYSLYASGSSGSSGYGKYYNVLFYAQKGHIYTGTSYGTFNYCDFTINTSNSYSTAANNFFPTSHSTFTSCNIYLKSTGSAGFMYNNYGTLKSCNIYARRSSSSSTALRFCYYNYGTFDSCTYNVTGYYWENYFVYYNGNTSSEGEIINCTFNNSNRYTGKSTRNGIVYYNRNTNSLISNCVYTFNSAYGYACYIYSNYGEVTNSRLELGSSVSQNTSSTNTFVFNNYSNATISNCSMRFNNATARGCFTYHNYSEINNTTFGASTVSNGMSQTTTATFDRCVVYTNYEAGVISNVDLLTSYGEGNYCEYVRFNNPKNSCVYSNYGTIYGSLDSISRTSFVYYNRNTGKIGTDSNVADFIVTESLGSGYIEATCIDNPRIVENYGTINNCKFRTEGYDYIKCNYWVNNYYNPNYGGTNIQGIFCTLNHEGATIKNVNITIGGLRDIKFNDSSLRYFGYLCGQNEGLITECDISQIYLSDTTSGSGLRISNNISTSYTVERIGLIVGHNGSGGQGITNCTLTDVNYFFMAGGATFYVNNVGLIAGLSDANITDCTISDGEIVLGGSNKTTITNMGLVTGTLHSHEISNCNVSGTLQTNGSNQVTNMGGIAGCKLSSNVATISSCDVEPIFYQTSVATTAYRGGVVGVLVDSSASLTIDNTTVTYNSSSIDFNGTNFGGMVAKNNGAILNINYGTVNFSTSSVFGSTFTSGSTGKDIAGFVNVLTGSTSKISKLYRCRFTGYGINNVSVVDDFGGFIGKSSNYYILEECINNASYTKGSWCGGLTAYTQSNATIKNCVVYADCGSYPFVRSSSSSVTVSYCYSKYGSSTGGGNTNSNIVSNNSSTFSSTSFNKMSNIFDPEIWDVPLTNASTTNGTSGVNTHPMLDWYQVKSNWTNTGSAGLAVNNKIVRVTTGQGLVNALTNYNSNGYTIQLANDIDLTGKYWIPFDLASGCTIDGQFYNINGANCVSSKGYKDNTYNNGYGFFTDINGTLKNITFNNTYVLFDGLANTWRFGGISGNIFGTLDRVITYAKVANSSGITGINGISGGGGVTFSRVGFRGIIQPRAGVSLLHGFAEFANGFSECFFEGLIDLSSSGSISNMCAFGGSGNPTYYTDCYFNGQFKNPSNSGQSRYYIFQDNGSGSSDGKRIYWTYNTTKTQSNYGVFAGDLTISGIHTWGSGGVINSEYYNKDFGTGFSSGKTSSQLQQFNSTTYNTWDFLGVWNKTSTSTGLPTLWWTKPGYTRYDLTDVKSPDTTGVDGFSTNYVNVTINRTGGINANSSTNGGTSNTYTLTNVSQYIYMPISTSTTYYLKLSVIDSQKNTYGFYMTVTNTKNGAGGLINYDDTTTGSSGVNVAINSLTLYCNGTNNVNTSVNFSPATRGYDIVLSMDAGYMKYYFKVTAPSLGMFAVSIKTTGGKYQTDAKDPTQTQSGVYYHIVDTATITFSTFYGYTVEIRYMGNTARVGSTTVTYSGINSAGSTVSKSETRTHAVTNLTKDGVSLKAYNTPTTNSASSYSSTSVKFDTFIAGAGNTSVGVSGSATNYSGTFLRLQYFTVFRAFDSVGNQSASFGNVTVNVKNGSTTIYTSTLSSNSRTYTSFCASPEYSVVPTASSTEYYQFNNFSTSYLSGSNNSYYYTKPLFASMTATLQKTNGAQISDEEIANLNFYYSTSTSPIAASVTRLNTTTINVNINSTGWISNYSFAVPYGYGLVIRSGSNTNNITSKTVGSGVAVSKPSTANSNVYFIAANYSVRSFTKTFKFYEEGNVDYVTSEDVPTNPYDLEYNSYSVYVLNSETGEKKNS